MGADPGSRRPIKKVISRITHRPTGQKDNPGTRETPQTQTPSSHSSQSSKIIQQKWKNLYAGLLRRTVDNDLLELAQEFATAAVPGQPDIKTRAIGSLTRDEVAQIFPFKPDVFYGWHLSPNETDLTMPIGLGKANSLHSIHAMLTNSRAFLRSTQLLAR